MCICPYILFTLSHMCPHSILSFNIHVKIFQNIIYWPSISRHTIKVLLHYCLLFIITIFLNMLLHVFCTEVKVEEVYSVVSISSVSSCDRIGFNKYSLSWHSIGSFIFWYLCIIYVTLIMSISYELNVFCFVTQYILNLII